MRESIADKRREQSIVYLFGLKELNTANVCCTSVKGNGTNYWIKDYFEIILDVLF